MRIISSCMDTKKESRIPECGNVPDLTGVKTVVGAKQLKKAVEAGRARYVFLAENADPAVIEPIVLLCRSKEVQTVWVPVWPSLAVPVVSRWARRLPPSWIDSGSIGRPSVEYKTRQNGENKRKEKIDAYF